MPGEIEFDMAGALGEISDGLGFDTETDTDDNLKVEATDVDLGAAEKAAEATGIAAPGSETPETPPTSMEVPSAPKTWRAEAAASWSSLPETVRAEILKREDDIFRGIEGYKSDAAFGKSLKGALDPFLPTLQKYGIDPARQISGLMSAHQTLALGSPDEKIALFQKLASDYGIDLGAVSAEAPFVDPAVQALRSELSTIKSQLSQAETAKAAAEAAEMQRSVTAFAADPAHPHFGEVASDMAVLLQKGVCADLKEAYEKAVWANPVTRAKEISRQQAEASKAAEAEKAKRIAAARSASAANVRTRAKQGSDTTPTGSIDDTLEAAYASIVSRS
jgi:hypothetical protein